MPAYYNEIDPYAADWLRNLITAGHIAAGDVDTRSIEDVTPDDLRNYTQCHFFAGVGVWSLALRSAGWSDGRPVWTGSCPCQPFSAAGKGEGFTDERHLWPAWFHLIGECRPCVVFGEQVASKNGLGWLDLVHTDLEAAQYAVGAVDLCAAGVGAPHIRQRLWFVAHADRDGRQPRSEGCATLGHRTTIEPNRSTRGMANTDRRGCGTQGRMGAVSCVPGRGTDQRVSAPLASVCGGRHTGATHGFWRDADWLFCRDGKWRPVEPGTSPLAHGIANRVGRLRAYGNAINKEAAEAFIRSYDELTQLSPP